MRITISNNIQLANKYLRFIKWKLYNIKDKFDQLIYVDVFLKAEGQSPKTYYANIRLGVPGHDIILQHKSKDINVVFKKSNKAIHRYLAKQKKLTTNK